MALASQPLTDDEFLAAFHSRRLPKEQFRNPDHFRLAWLHLLATHREPTFEEFLRQNEARLNLDTLHRFWSPELLASDRARREWVPPDREELPR